MTKLEPPPAGWPRIISSVFYDDARGAIAWLCGAFGFEVRLEVLSEHGHVEHSELTFGDDGLIMVGQSGGKSTRRRDRERAVGDVPRQRLRAVRRAGSDGDREVLSGAAADRIGIDQHRAGQRHI